MALLKFLKGNYSSLNSATIAEGQILICSDTGEMFVDVAADKRVKIGDYVTVANLDALFAIDATSVPTSRLYYVEGANILARSNGTDWDQINKDTGATSIEVVGEGNAVTAASYDAVTRKLTLTKGETFATKAELDTLDVFVGDIPEGYTEKTIVAYINKKAEETLNSASGGSSESAASVLAALNTYKSENDPKVQANTEAIEALQEANAEGGAVATAIAEAQAAADQAQKEVNELETVVSDYKTANDAAVAKKAEADNVYTKAEIDGKVSALENADLAINNKIGTVDEGDTLVGLIEAAQAKADAAYVKPADGIGTNDLHADVVASLGKAESALQAADIANKADKATTLAGYGITDAYTKGEVDAAVGAKVAQGDYDTKVKALEDEDARIAGLVSNEVTAREEADTALDERLIKVEAFFDGAAEDGEGLQNALDTLVEIQNYVDTHGEAAKTMLDNIAANTKAIADEAKRADDAEKALGGRIDDLSDVVEGKAAATELTALDERVTAEEGKVATLQSEMDAVEQKAADNATAIEALQAASATHALDTDLDAAVERIAANETAVGNLQTVTQTTTETLNAHVENTDIHVTTADKEKWNGAQAAAEATAATNLANARTEITAEIAKAKGDAISDAEGKIATAKDEAIADAEGKIATAKGEAIADAEGKVNAAKTELKGNIDTVSGDLEDYKTANDAAVKLKANAADVYTKTEVEDMLTWGTF